MRYKNLICAAFLLFLQFHFAFAQPNAESVDFLREGTIPPKFKASLKTRLEQFITAMRDERWETVSEMLSNLGDSPKGAGNAAERKQCLIDQIKAEPLIKFEPNRTTTSTAFFNKPLEQKRWWIEGTGEFKTDSSVVSKRIVITVSLQKSIWVFLPEIYLDKWEENKVSQTTEADYVKFVEVIQSPDAPVEISIVSVKRNSKFPFLRNLTFEVYNKTAKSINGISYRTAGTLSGNSQNIEPQKSVRIETSIGVPIIFCVGEQTQKLFIDTVWFADKTEWKLKTIKK